MTSKAADGSGGRERRMLAWLRGRPGGAEAAEIVRRFRGVSLRELERRGAVAYRGGRWFPAGELPA